MADLESGLQALKDAAAKVDPLGWEVNTDDFAALCDDGWTEDEADYLAKLPPRRVAALVAVAQVELDRRALREVGVDDLLDDIRISADIRRRADAAWVALEETMQ